MAEAYTSRQIIDGAAKWGIGVDETEGGPGRVGLIHKGHLIAIVPSPLNLNPTVRKHGDLMRGLMSYVRVGHPDQFLYGPVTEARPMQQQKEHSMSVEPTPEGYVPMVNRPPLPESGRPNSISTLIQEVVCFMDRPVKATEVYPEVVKYAPYATLDTVKAGLNNMANGALQGRYIKRFDYVSNPDYGKVPRAQDKVARWVVDPPFRIEEADITRLPDWRPAEQKKRKSAGPRRKKTLKDQQRESAEKKARDAQRAARKRGEKKLAEGRAGDLTEIEAKAVGRVRQNRAPLSEPTHRNLVRQEDDPQPQPQLPTGSTFTPMARDFDDPSIVILRDEQGNMWEARLSDKYQ